MASVVVIVFVVVDIPNNSFCLCIYIGVADYLAIH